MHDTGLADRERIRSIRTANPRGIKTKESIETMKKVSSMHNNVSCLVNKNRIG